MIIKNITALCLPVVLAALLNGCMKDSRGDCPSGEVCILTVRAYDDSGVELTGNDVSSVLLYVFDGGLRFVQSIPARLGETVRLEALPGEDLNIVAWGNLNGRGQVTLGNDLRGSSVQLVPDSRADNYITSADDIFLGDITIKSGDQGNRDIPIFRMMGSMAVTVRNPASITGTGGGYSIGVRETFSAIGFDGALSGDKVSYRPHGKMAVNGGGLDYYVEPFNMVPEEGGVEIDIYHEGALAATVTRNNDGTPIAVYRGQLTNVLIQSSGGGDPTLNVSVTVTPWGQAGGEKEF